MLILLMKLVDLLPADLNPRAPNGTTQPGIYYILSIFFYHCNKIVSLVLYPSFISL